MPESTTVSHADKFSSSAPSDQNVIDIFTSEWSSVVPGLTSTGHADLFNDVRLIWMDREFGVKGRTVLELGPLEGAHSYMLSKMGASSITSIEANQSAFLKCLCVKEIFDLTSVRFRLGDFRKFFESNNERFDIILASGVLYHMTDPLRLLSELIKRTDRIFLWTHIYEPALIQNREDHHLFRSPLPVEHDGRTYDCVRKDYAQAALDWNGFSGGSEKYATWLTRESLLDFFSAAGFTTKVDFDHPDHPNGPALALCASRVKPKLFRFGWPWVL